jgi:cytochrome c nitrite reductase small subunit
MTRILTAVFIGVFIGVGMYTFHYAEGFSYVSTEPRVCANCHIMRPQLDSWQKSSHHKAALCVDCHLPHDFIGKYIAKADNGRRHSTGFTFQNFHEPITITEKDSRILQKNCVRCHEPMVQDLVMVGQPDSNTINCVRCHEGVGHGERVGLGRMDKNNK